ncbi:hydroxyisourate hydrolase [Phormidium sp. CLA17]|uniref:hydroxyisourate hydrolase n=1 Tax=Leptolyngbya sp. Cla-17 TaxID=2803751 RepID=UPI001491DDA3|nr:hydroxyisourate hydrolase [Leptolyngbya sp. Cla-17]MBM0741256.1 hydroxyisourate hydrolase [Leptolyngbya sp. Cla-17]
MAGKLTTHVLDTAQGKPAANMAIELWSIDSASDQKMLLKAIATNSDGRTDSPLLIDEEFKIGVYELIFIVGNYFANQPVETTLPPFLNRVLIQFGIANVDAHYHVPLLVSPWAYSTYRGS